MWCTQYASLLVLSISRREETFPLAQYFHPDHHDPDDRVPLTVWRVFSFFFSFSLLVSIHLAKNFSARELQTSPSKRTISRKSRLGSICGVFSSRESEERSVASNGEPAHREKRSERDREESTWTVRGTRGGTRRRDGRENRFPGGPGDQPPAGDPGHSPRFYKQPNTVHPPPVLPSSPAS